MREHNPTGAPHGPATPMVTNWVFNVNKKFGRAPATPAGGAAGARAAAPRPLGNRRPIPHNPPTMSNRAGELPPEQFVEKWSKAQLSERAASHEHFLDLCHLLGQPTPAEADATGADYCFEKHVKVVGSASKGAKGDDGFVDVWSSGESSCEYKGNPGSRLTRGAARETYDATPRRRGPGTPVCPPKTPATPPAPT